MNDGFGNLTASCREYTLPRAHQDSVVKLWIQKYREIGPVLGVKTFGHLHKQGFEIQVTCTFGGNSNIWVSFLRLTPLRG